MSGNHLPPEKDCSAPNTGGFKIENKPKYLYYVVSKTAVSLIGVFSVIVLIFIVAIAWILSLENLDPIERIDKTEEMLKYFCGLLLAMLIVFMRGLSLNKTRKRRGGSTRLLEAIEKVLILIRPKGDSDESEE